MQTCSNCSSKQPFWQYFLRHPLARTIVGPVIVVTVLGVTLAGALFGGGMISAFAQGACATSDQTYVVRGGDTLGVIAARYHTSWQQLASYNHLPNPNMINIGQNICIPTSQGSPPTTNGPASPSKGDGNSYPYGYCTWWGDQRYFQIHGFYVPWKSNANAYQWQQRAVEFGWKVTTTPAIGAIIDLQPGVQGAGGLGHVGVVEQILSGGRVVTSNMNWGPGNFGHVTYVTFYLSPGMTFITA